jgi:guanine deaminase
MESQIFRASVLNPVSDTEIQYFKDGALIINSKNQVDRVCNYSELTQEEKNRTKELSDGNGRLHAVIPGLCDVHFHWVQDKVSDMDKDNLLDWLESFVFPEESQFHSTDFAANRADAFAEKLLRCGTLSGAVYGSIHSASIKESFSRFRGDFRIGNVVMTENAPDTLKKDLSYYQELLSEMLEAYGDKYIVTPRFALSCNPEVMSWLGDFSKKHNLWIQTHLSENKREIEETLSMYRAFKGFEDVQDYLEVYERCNLIGSRSVLGHCIHLSHRELESLAANGAKVAHCPTSNAPVEERGLGSGLMDYEKMDEYGVEWALASDIGAGPYLSMLDVMKSFLFQHERAGRSPGVARALYRATAKAAELIGYSNRGNFNPGMVGDFICLPGADAETGEQYLEQLLDRDREDFNSVVEKVFVSGELYTF